jgi:hydroxysqualene synthase
MDPYAYCERLARGHYENFPVASRLLPRRMRPHVAAIYAFARIADDIADEGTRAAADRLVDLESWGRRFEGVLAGRADEGPHAPVLAAIGRTIESCQLPVHLFEDLLSAFRQDVLVTRYATWADVLDYCRRSANPVGRLVLRVAGYANPQLDKWSDAICTALQLTNFWQDLSGDLAAGRLYVPAELSSAAREEDLQAHHLTAAWQSALIEAGRRTRALFVAGRPVCDAVTGRLRAELRATWLGGTRILEKLDAAHFDVFAHRPALGSRDAVAILWRVLTWRREPVPQS